MDKINKGVIILGTSRKDGDTTLVANSFSQSTKWDIIDLADFKFGYFDYSHENRNDDFIPLIERIVDKYDLILFASPVYWYAMSGIMKVFFDRLSDILTIEKDLGRRLRGKQMGIISCSNAEMSEMYFEIPFVKSAAYLGMQYFGYHHSVVVDKKLSDVEVNKLEGFAKTVLAIV